jgi:hypothetical protein
MPDAVVFTAPGASVRLRELAAGRPLLLFFYLFDFSST